jgi:cobalt-zinc-cadmium efflux system protein
MSKHSHHHGPAAFNRAFAIGIALNLGFVVVEAAYGWQAGSLALLADAGHNLSDVAGLVLAWVAALAAGRLPDHRHTYGWQRASILAAFANAVLLLVAMGSLLWEAGHRLQAPAPTDGITIMVVAAIGVLVNGATAALFMSGSKSDMNIRGAFLHMAGDALVSLGVVGSGALYLCDRLGLARSADEHGDRAGDHRRHLAFVPPIPASAVRRRAGKRRARRGRRCCAPCPASPTCTTCMSGP